MLKKFDIHGIHKILDKKLHKYVTKKLGRIDRYMAPKYKQSAYLEVRLKESRLKGENHCLVTAVLQLPKQNIVIKEKSINMYAAVDIVEAKLKQQIQKYKYKHGGARTRRSQLFTRFSRQGATI